MPRAATGARAHAHQARRHYRAARLRDGRRDVGEKAKVMADRLCCRRQSIRTARLGRHSAVKVDLHRSTTRSTTDAHRHRRRVLASGSPRRSCSATAACPTPASATRSHLDDPLHRFLSNNRMAARCCSSPAPWASTGSGSMCLPGYPRAERAPAGGRRVLMILRQLSQYLTALPAPEGMIWFIPACLVPGDYGVTNDLFFSGHTALAVYGALTCMATGGPSSGPSDWRWGSMRSSPCGPASARDDGCLRWLRDRAALLLRLQ